MGGNNNSNANNVEPGSDPPVGFIIGGDLDDLDLNEAAPNTTSNVNEHRQADSVENEEGDMKEKEGFLIDRPHHKICRSNNPVHSLFKKDTQNKKHNHRIKLKHNSNNNTSIAAPSNSDKGTIVARGNTGGCKVSANRYPSTSSVSTGESVSGFDVNASTRPRRPSMRLPSTFVESRMKGASAANYTDMAALFYHQTIDMEYLQKHFQETFLEDFRQQYMIENSIQYQRTTTFGFLDVSPFITSGMESIVEDSFTKCFELEPEELWNWNAYLFPLYCFGFLLRYTVMLPLRLLCLGLGTCIFFLLYPFSFMFRINQRTTVQQYILKIYGFFWVMSWTGVIKYHGVCPKRRPNQIFVANHTSVIDIIVLLNHQIFCCVGQKHQGVIGFFQDYVLSCMNNLWFNRMDLKDRQLVAKRIKHHIQDPDKPPLLVFPEGTCVNNDYAVMFKRGAFDLDAEVVPVAIKYNRKMADAFWNSRLHSFPRHIFRLLTSWCLVADVWFLDPMKRRPDESAIDFAARVKEAICNKADIISTPWDGYLKYFRPSHRETQARQKIYAEALAYRFGVKLLTDEQKEKSIKNMNMKNNHSTPPKKDKSSNKKGD